MRPLIELENSFAALVKSGGEIILSGVLETQVEAITSIYSNNFRLSLHSEQGGWALIAGVRK
jgi:ribosomal protein L11 methyltransferase